MPAQWIPIFLAQGGRLNDLSTGFRDPSPARLTPLLLALGLAFLAAGLLWALRMARRLWHQRRLGDPEALFHDLARLHQLTRPQWRFLHEVARRKDASNPARIFVHPEWLAESSPTDMGRQLAEILFGGGHVNLEQVSGRT